MIFVKFGVLVEPLSSQGTGLKNKGYSCYYICQLKFVAGLNKNYEFYENCKNYENCEESQFLKDLQRSEYCPNLWLKRLNENCEFYENYKNYEKSQVL